VITGIILKAKGHPPPRMAFLRLRLKERTAYGGIDQGVQVIVAVSDEGFPRAADAFEHTGKLPESDEELKTVPQFGFCAWIVQLP
jgi:hypothetical protein